MEKYYFLEMENEEVYGDDNWFLVLPKEAFLEEELQNKKSTVEGVEYKIFTVDEAIEFIKKHPARRVYKETLNTVEDEDIKKKIIKNINLV